MPTPPLDRLRQSAGRFFEVAGPPARTVRDRVTREVGQRLSRRRGREDQDVTPQRAADPAPRTEGTEAPPAPAAGPNPASIAKNVAHQRPRAKAPGAARRDPESVPGGKLPPRRPRPA